MKKGWKAVNLFPGWGVLRTAPALGVGMCQPRMDAE